MPIRANTKEILEKAFWELLAEKDLEEITVADITGRCGASRTTFYKHFRDKYDLMTWSYEKHANRLFDGQLSRYEGTLRVYSWIRSNPSFFYRVIEYQKQNGLFDFIVEYSVSKFKDRLMAVEDAERREDLLFALKHYLSGSTYMLFEWIRRKFDIPTEVFVRRTCDDVPAVLLPYIDQSPQDVSQP